MKRVLLCSLLLALLIPGLTLAQGYSINMMDAPKGPSLAPALADVSVETYDTDQVCVLFGWFAGPQFLPPMS